MAKKGKEGDAKEMKRAPGGHQGRAYAEAKVVLDISLVGASSFALQILLITARQFITQAIIIAKPYTLTNNLSLSSDHHIMHSVSHRAECVLRSSPLHPLPSADLLLGERSESTWLLHPLFYDVIVVMDANFRLKRRACDGDPKIIEPKESWVEDVDEDDEMPDLMPMEDDSACQYRICHHRYLKAKL
ncbi:hypothetical protein C8R44DRAFT_889554 [Mycena epipterygia]|nr:hypothetical protein C8R44DRAFT_889554 [Mycena epipterygia]